MPRAAQRSKSSAFTRRRSFGIFLVLLLGCKERSPPEQRASSTAQARASAEPVRVRRPAPAGDFDCRELRPAPKTENDVSAETIELAPPGPGKHVFSAKTDVVVSYDREDFLKAARCMKLDKAIRYIEQETGQAAESPLYDAFQLSYVEAALLDAGRASVRLEAESDSRKSIVRDGWAADGCKGHCRSFGRVYRLSDDDSWFFIRITDHTRYDGG